MQGLSALMAVVTLLRLSVAACGLLGLGAASAAGECPPPAEQVVQALNLLRASPRSCGGSLLPAAPALAWQGQLATSAQDFATELARRDTLSHEGQTARTLRERLRAAGYSFRSAGENLAAGADDLDEVLGQWLSSPAHCENLMQPNFRDVGLACVPGTGRYDHFWVLHLGRSSAVKD